MLWGAWAGEDGPAAHICWTKPWGGSHGPVRGRDPPPPHTHTFLISPDAFHASKEPTLGPCAVVRLRPGDPAPSGPLLEPGRSRAPGARAHGNTERQVVNGLRTEVCGQQKQSNDPHNNRHNFNMPTTGRRTNGTPYHIQHSPNTPTTGLRERGNDTSKSSGRNDRQKAATRRNMRREEQVTVQGPVKKQQPDGMSHRGVAWPSART